MRSVDSVYLKGNLQSGIEDDTVNNSHAYIIISAPLLKNKDQTQKAKQSSAKNSKYKPKVKVQTRNNKRIQQRKARNT